MRVGRSTVIIGPQHGIALRRPEVEAEGHAEKAQAKLKELRDT